MFAPHSQQRRIISERPWIGYSGNDLPYSNTGIPAGIDIKETWSRALRDSFTQQHRFHPTLRLTESKKYANLSMTIGTETLIIGTNLYRI